MPFGFINALRSLSSQDEYLSKYFDDLALLVRSNEDLVQRALLAQRSVLQASGNQNDTSLQQRLFLPRKKSRG